MGQEAKGFLSVGMGVVGRSREKKKNEQKTDDMMRCDGCTNSNPQGLRDE